MDTLDRAARFLRLHGRLIDRLRFEALFADGPRDRVLDVLRCYQNADGGFGNALEPDLRGAGSQPQPVEVAFWILDEIDAFDSPMVAAACDYLVGITAAGGGVPFVLPSVRDMPRAPWWQTDDDPPGDLNPTAALAGLLHKHGATHPWLGPATDFCWSRVAALTETTSYEARALLVFLEHVPDRERALAEFARLRDAVLATVTLDTHAEGAVHYPLDFAPTPSPLPLFDAATLDAHLDAMAADQTEEGGWHPNWAIWTPLAAHEWAGHLTLQRLKTLRAYGHLPA
ncbi:hypothetical protein [Nonomuraea sp. NPDC052265]|uniref:hypothetical protein n=1 Tax=Nonomuraea sp. NPDC052265 TaxID=3364374 RepID=UPI0037CCB641